MVTPLSNSKLRIPKGFQSLLVGLSTEILRSQPRNIPLFAAEYFEKLVHRRDQGHMYASDQQTALEDRYYTNQSFQEDYPINDPEVAHAATKIQAQFRGHKARRDFEKIKHENQTGATKSDSQKLTSLESQNLQKEEMKDEKSFDDEEGSEEEKRQLERAAISIQAQFRGFQVRKALREPSDIVDEEKYIDYQQQDYDRDHDKPSTLSSTHSRGRHDLSGNPRLYDEIEDENTNDSDRPQLEREPTQLSEDFERQKGLFHDSDSYQGRQRSFTDQDDMSDSNLDKAATRIQASYRGYKTRKELGSTSGHPHSGHDQQLLSSPSTEMHHEYDNGRNKNILSPSAEGNKEPVHEEDDNAAAVKIQAAYRGYRVRKDLEK